MTPNPEPPMKLEMYILERETARNEPFTYQEKDELKLIWEAQEARIARMNGLLEQSRAVIRSVFGSIALVKDIEAELESSK